MAVLWWVSRVGGLTRCALSTRILIRFSEPGVNLARLVDYGGGGGELERFNSTTHTMVSVCGVPHTVQVTALWCLCVDCVIQCKPLL